MNIKQQINDHLVLIAGKSATGKSASLRGLQNQDEWIYLGCEAGKRLPFKNNFRTMNITDPMQVFNVFEQAEAAPKIRGIIIDSVTYLMDMYESVHVITAKDSRSAWGNYAQYWKTLMQNYVARSSKKVIMIAHTLDQLNESEMIVETKVPIKGALKNQGLESYFSTVIATKKVPLSALDDYKNDLLHITPQDEAFKLKYVFQTLLTKDTVNDRIRGPMGLFEQHETFIDNDIQLVLNRLAEYYGDNSQAA